MIKKIKTWLKNREFDEFDIKKILNIIWLFLSVSTLLAVVYYVSPESFRKDIIKEYGKTVLVGVVVAVSIMLHLLLNIILRSYRKISPEVIIGGFLNVLKVVVWIICLVFIATIYMNPKTLKVFLGGFGMLAAGLVVIFKEPLLGFFMIISMVFNKTIKINDWIKVPKHGADGTVTKIGLTSLVVRNFSNNCEVVIPAAIFFSEACVNNKNINQEVERVLEVECLIDPSSVKHHILPNTKHCKKSGINIEMFSEYFLNKVLKTHKMINQDKSILFGFHLESAGLYFKLRCFTIPIDQIEFKKISTEIIGNLITEAKFFELSFIIKNNNPNP